MRDRSRRISRREFLRHGARAAGAWAGLAVIGCQAQAQVPRTAASPTSASPAGPSPAAVGASPSPQTALKTRSLAAPLEDRAFASLMDQVNFGPRVPGQPGHADCRRYLAAELAKTTHQVATQDFSLSIAGADLELTNILARHNPEASDRVLLCAHWDTRPFADQDPNPANRNTPILGANDGASGVAALLEISRVLHERKVERGVDIVLFDGEDWGRTVDTMFLGSRHFATSALAEPASRPFGILLDMVGDADLHIYREGFSDRAADPVADRIWNAVIALEYQAYFSDEVAYTLFDDHVPLNEAGIMTADVIDFRYPYWHTVEDTPDKCSGASLRIVSEVVLRVLDEYWTTG
ncbi:MAG TPA: M28 family peptidase [Dehalococcoidia bacterium]|nr:M28 family peptidase [Dehalococcoidia bacterium]